MERLHQTFKTTITASQSIQLFSARKDPKRSWPEHYLYLVAVSDACGGADQQVLDNIVHYASTELSTVLMAKYDNSRADFLRQAEELAHFAQSVELESRKGRALGRDVVAFVNEVSTKRETRTCFGCGKAGHIKANCRSKGRSNHDGRRGKHGADLILAINDRGLKTKNMHLVYAVKYAKDEHDEWILDSGSSRHLVKDERLLLDAQDCNYQCNMADGETLSLSRVGSVRLCVMAGAKSGRSS